MDLHSHSNYSDGKNSIEQMVGVAVELGYAAIAITDHVWKTSDWIEDFSKHMRKVKKIFAKDIYVFSGLEAKVINLEGDIDAAPDVESKVDFLLGSIHRIPFSGGYYSTSKGILDSEQEIYNNWITSFENLLKNPRVDIIAHPLAELKRFHIELSQKQKIEIAELLDGSGKFVEINVRHNAPDQDMIELLRIHKTKVVVSSDSHSMEDLKRYYPALKNIYSLPLNFVTLTDLTK
ncbi:PHP domain-containing protein [Brevibacillus choshinensis]|uniref:PHP domain-containing protein n=1 Tax=Brevibacillus choshinensis TaxID=54911 RepID=UPI0006EBFA2D|nr:PHP domain-containing protein [Brevibacillus choshinensis]